MAIIDGTSGPDALTGTTDADQITGGAGNDIIDGNAGVDIIYGDSGDSLSAGGEGVPGDTLGDGPGSTGGGYDRVVGQPEYNTFDFSSDAFFLGNDIPYLDVVNDDPFEGTTFSQDGSGADRAFSMDEIAFENGSQSYVGVISIEESDSYGSDATMESSLTGPQEIVKIADVTVHFTMNDGTVFNNIRMYTVQDEDGNTFMVPSDGPTPSGFNAFRNMLETNDSGIASFEIHTVSGDNDGAIIVAGNWADGQFLETTDGDGGDDTIIGGEGADQMFGEGGDDTFIVGSAAEGAGDVISGGFGPDENTDNDTLDLTGAGPVTINATADANDAGAQSGTVTFEDGSTLTFEGIEEILTDDDSANPDYQPTSTDNLVSLWEFSENGSNTALDTAGVTSNGTMQGDAFMSNEELQLDGDGDYMLVQPDPEHQLSAGRIELVFNQDAHEGTSPDTLVSRDSGGRDDGGNFTMAVTEDGAVTVRHQTESDDVNFSTPDNFFATGDDVRVSYSWDEGGDGGTFLVENIATGATYEAAVPNTLTMDMGPDFNEPWTVGASQAVSGDNTADNLSEFFNGEISYVAIYDGNTAPTANDDVTNTAEGTAVQVNVLANDTDPEGGDLDILGTPTAANGTVAVDNETGEITYTPDPGFVGTDTITYTTVDEGGLTDTATLTVNVAATPDSGPDAVDDSITVFESEGAGDTDGNVLTNDLQDAGEPGPYTGGVVEVNGTTGNVGEWIDLPEGGRVLINSDGSVDFDANGDFEGLSDGESENVTIDYCIQTTSAASTGPNPGEGPTINVGTTLTNLVTIGGTGAETFAVGGDDDLIGGTAISVTGNLLPPLLFGNDNDTLDISGAVAQGWTPTELIRLPDQPLIGNGFSGSFLLTKDGELPVTVTYLEIENFVGFDNVTEKDAATLTVTVQGEEDAPVAEDDAADTLEDTPVTIDVLANDTDADDQPLTVTEATAPNGTVEINPDGTLEYTPDPDFNGDDVITYTVTDPDGNEATATVDVSVAPVEDAPVANPDVAEVDEDETVIIDVLGNDTDPNGDDLAVIAADAPNGTVEINPDGTLEYTPDPDFNGDDVITYTVTDPDGNEATSTVDVTVAPVEDAPVAEDDAADTLEDTPVTIDVLANDTDADDQPLTVTEATAPNGTVEINPDGTLEYTPDPDFNGDDVITYTVTDPDGNEDTAEVAVSVTPVEDTPVANPDVAEVDEDETVIIDVLGNDTDPNGDPLTVTEATAPNGTVEINPDGTLEYTPDPDFNGDDVITYTVTDPDGNEATTTVDVTVAPVEDAPVAEDDAADTLEDTPVTIDVLGNDTDADGDPLTVTEATAPNGTVEINPDGTLDYTPDPEFSGEDTITYTIADPDGETSTATVTVTVGDVPDAPVANPDTAEVEEGDTVVIDVLANDTDPDTAPEDLEVIAADAPNGTVDFNPDGTITYEPDVGFVGEDTITYTVTDPEGNTDTSTVAVTVTPEPGGDDPVAVADEYDFDLEGYEGGTIRLTSGIDGVLSNDTDPNDDPLTVVAVEESTNLNRWVDADNGGQIRVAPNGTVRFRDNDGDFDELPDGDVAQTSVSYTVSDGNGGTDTVTVTINVTGAAVDADNSPDAVDDVASATAGEPTVIDVLANDTDPDNTPDELQVTAGDTPNGTVDVNPDGTITYEPDVGFTGEDTITYTITDPDGNSDTAAVTVTVAEEDVTPEANPDVAEVDEDETVIIDVLGNDTDPNGDPLTVTEATAPNGTVEINPDGTLEYTPDPDFNGDDVITYTVTDPDGNEATSTVDVTVAPVEDAPVAEDDAADTLEDTPVTIDVLANDTDADDQPLTVTEATAPNGTVEINPDGTLEYTPDPDFNGDDVITYTVTDPDGNEATATVDVSVAPVEDAPVANPDVAEVDEDETVIIDVLGNDTDPNGDDLAVIAADAPNGTVEINPDGTLEYTPDPDFNGDDVITYTVTDPDGNEATSTVDVTVAPVEDAPVAEDDAADTLEDTPVTIDVLANDTDADDQPLTVTEATAPNGTVEINPDGTLEYTPDPDFNGDDVITYTVTDPDGNEATATVDVSVAPATGGDGVVDGTGGDDVMSPGYEDPEGDQIDGDDGDEDVIDPGAGDDIVDAGDGDDTILGGDGDDVIDGGEGDDTYVAADDSVVQVTFFDDDQAYVQDFANGSEDQVSDIENFVADETEGNDKIKFLEGVQADEIQGLSDDASGFFFGDDGSFVGFGPGNDYALSDLLGGTSPDGELDAVGPVGEYVILGGDEDGQIGETSFENFETISFFVEEDDETEDPADYLASLSNGDVLDETVPVDDEDEELESAEF